MRRRLISSGGRPKGARYVTSVCTGALVLGAAGLLKGKRAATHWMSREMLAAFGATPVTDRVVVDGNVITGGGVTAGIDFALVVAAEAFGRDVAETIQLGIEYDPHPPFTGRLAGIRGARPGGESPRRRCQASGRTAGRGGRRRRPAALIRNAMTTDLRRPLPARESRRRDRAAAHPGRGDGARHVTMLDRIGVGPGWRCLDIGCGPGGITGLLSERVGPEWTRGRPRHGRAAPRACARQCARQCRVRPRRCLWLRSAGGLVRSRAYALRGEHGRRSGAAAARGDAADARRRRGRAAGAGWLDAQLPSAASGLGRLEGGAARRLRRRRRRS